METTIEVLKCGCKRELVGNKWITIEECPEHDPELAPQQQKPFIKKFKKSVQDYI